MGIKSIAGGGTVATGEGVSYVRLASLRGMLRMEKAGMKSRGGALRPRIAAELGLKARDSYDTFIDTVQAENKAEMEMAK